MRGARVKRRGSATLGLLLIGLLLALVLHWRDWLRVGRLWLLLLLLSAGMFAIGFLRGDFSVIYYSLRLDQWLDMSMALFAGILLVKQTAGHAGDVPGQR